MQVRLWCNNMSSPTEREKRDTRFRRGEESEVNEGKGKDSGETKHTLPPQPASRTVKTMYLTQNVHL